MFFQSVNHPTPTSLKAGEVFVFGWWNTTTIWPFGMMKTWSSNRLPRLRGSIR